MEMNSKQEVEAPKDEITRQTSNLRFRWEWAEASIWTDKMLTALENGVKGNKWFSLIDKVHRPHTLSMAWEKVRANKGAAGIDRVTVERFASKKDTYLKELEEALKDGTYIPKAVKRVYIPKGQGKMRPLGIPSVSDRIAQQAVKLVIEPIFEKEFLDNSYGFRPGRKAKDALREVDRLIAEGYTFALDADLQSYFDTIPHHQLMSKIKAHISDGRLLTLIEQWLRQEIIEECKSWIPDQGSPQGAVLSPLLANLYLHGLDIVITQAGGKIVRYADDFVILNKNQEAAEDMLKIVQEWVTNHGLTLHPEKTHIGNCLIEGQGFEFLGYRFENKKRWIRKKSIMKLRDKVRMLTPRTCGQSITKVIKTLNPVLRGWYEYFKHANKWGLGTFDSFVRRRLRAILRKQKKRPGMGWVLKDHMTWPNKFFANLGLFVMEDHRRLEVARQSR